MVKTIPPMNEAPSKCRLSGHGFGVGAGVVEVGVVGVYVNEKME